MKGLFPLRDLIQVRPLDRQHGAGGTSELLVVQDGDHASPLPKTKARIHLPFHFFACPHSCLWG